MHWPLPRLVCVCASYLRIFANVSVFGHLEIWTSNGAPIFVPGPPRATGPISKQNTFYAFARSFAVTRHPSHLTRIKFTQHPVCVCMLPFRMTRQTWWAGVSANLKRPTNQGNEISFITTLCAYFSYSSTLTCFSHFLFFFFFCIAQTTSTNNRSRRLRKKLGKKWKIENKKLPDKHLVENLWWLFAIFCWKKGEREIKSAYLRKQQRKYIECVFCRQLQAVCGGPCNGEHVCVCWSH